MEEAAGGGGLALVAVLMEVAVSLGLVVTQVSLGLGHIRDS